MSNYLRGSWKVFSRYSICLLIFLIFGITFFKFRYICTFILFLLMALMVYAEMNGLAIYEKKPFRNIKTYPFKGLVVGTLGFLPFIILTIILLNINFADPIHGNGIKLDYNRLKHSIQIALLCPLYIPLKAGGESIPAYAVSLAIVPLISMAGYITGFYGFEFKSYFLKLRKKKVQTVNKPGGRNVR